MLGGVAAVAGGAIGMVDGFVTLGIAGVLLGVSTSLAFVPALSVSTEVVDRRHQPRLQGRNGAIQFVAALAGVVVGSAVAADRQIAFGCLAGLGVAILAASVAFPSSDATSGPSHSVSRSIGASYGRAIHLLLTSAPVQFAALTATIFTLLWVSVGGSFVPLYMLTDLGYSGEQMGAVLAFRAILAALASLGLGWVVAKIGLGAATVIPFAAGLAITASVGLSELAAPALIAASGLALGFVIVSGNISLALGTASHERTIAVAATIFTSRIAAFIIPILIGIALDAFGFGATFAAAAVLGALLLLLLLIRIARGGFTSTVDQIDSGTPG